MHRKWNQILTNFWTLIINISRRLNGKPATSRAATWAHRLIWHAAMDSFAGCQKNSSCQHHSMSHRICFIFVSCCVAKSCSCLAIRIFFGRGAACVRFVWTACECGGAFESLLLVFFFQVLMLLQVLH